MGTRADFYVGRGKKAEWVGSIAWDGSLKGLRENGDAHEISARIIGATNEADFRKAVNEFICAREDGTAPAQGWPWPWETSASTDYAYAWDDGVWMSHFGAPWRDATGPECVEPWHDCSHYAWYHFPEADGTKYGSRQWLGLEPPRFNDAIAVIVKGKRYELGGSGSRGSKFDPHDFRADPGYWWMSVKGEPSEMRHERWPPGTQWSFQKKNVKPTVEYVVCVARVLKDDAHRLMPNVQLVFPPTSVAGETVSEKGALIGARKGVKERTPGKKPVFPDMSKESNFTMGKRSGVTTFGIAEGEK